MSDKEIFKSVSAIWGDEHKTIAECAERIYDFMLLIKEHNGELFGRWYEQAMSVKEALERKVEITQEYFYKQVKDNWSKRQHLGTQVWLWTGHEKDGYSSVINFRLGGHPNNPNLSNACVVTLPYKGEWAQYYKKPGNQIALMHLMQEFWNPNFLKVNGKKIEKII